MRLYSRLAPGIATMDPLRYSLLNAAFRSRARYSPGVYRLVIAAVAIPPLRSDERCGSTPILLRGPPRRRTEPGDHFGLSAVSVDGRGTCAGLARYLTSERTSCSERGVQRSSGIIDCSLRLRSAISPLGSVTVSLAV